jgi:hypothetical protein
MEAGYDSGYSQGPAPRDYPPTDLIELNKDFFQPSQLYSKFSEAIQKDMTLGNISKSDFETIRKEQKLIEALTMAYDAQPKRWAKLKVTIRDEYREIMNIISLGRGRDGFTARLMRTTFAEQKASMQHLTSMERRQEGMVGKARRFVGI